MSARTEAAVAAGVSRNLTVTQRNRNSPHRVPSASATPLARLVGLGGTTGASPGIAIAR
ncbi:hypothetical protein OU787_08535 [Kitasatospora sp. YST-16]|uniref:hypothetical protein n=1 Tax=Kitasatospora sp. YST-16 TaxID=2998080 RepID=UPI0022850FAF|nr:hypothetical protein [Kitasatospora sp. YST-16]WAL71545.1 hypothetical protein OU787_08535 [Kitasatospora sp. YST-16]WNW37585.1 hypothetical protein RKE32_08480 [Streptomyces sp. Li-HN-5-13]